MPHDSEFSRAAAAFGIVLGLLSIGIPVVFPQVPLTIGYLCLFGAGIALVYAAYTAVGGFRRLRRPASEAKGRARLFDPHKDPVGWHAVVKLERDPAHPDIDPPTEDPCEIDLILTDMATGKSESTQALVLQPTGGYQRRFPLAVTEKPLSALLVYWDEQTNSAGVGGIVGLPGSPWISGGLKLMPKHEYTLLAKVMRGVRKLGRQTYSIRGVESLDTLAVAEAPHSPP